MTKITDKQLADIMGQVLKLIPDAVVDEDAEGQLVIYTNLEMSGQ